MAEPPASRSAPRQKSLLEELQKSGLLTRRQVTRFRVDTTVARSEPADELSRLVASGLLTDFQARRISEGRMSELTLGNYTLRDRLGAGGMGEVFRAVHRRMKREVALKILPAAAVSNEEAVQRFHRETETAALLNHPNIVRAFDADESAGVHFLVMELVDGEDLARYVRTHGPLPPSLAVECVIQAARGLDHAHQQGVIHRDIKPSNLLLDSEGTVRILDLGLARLEDHGVIPDSEDTPELTQSGSIMGTVDYMAPEQAEDTRSADARCDIYSLGCTLYFLIAGRTPYSGKSAVQRLLAHREQPQPDLPDMVPASLQSIFRKMIARNPADRYQSMTEPLAALEACLASEHSLNAPEESTDLSPSRSTSSFASHDSRIAPTVTMEQGAGTEVAPSATSTATDASLTASAGTGKRFWWAIVPLLAIVASLGLMFGLQTPAGTVILEIADSSLIGAEVFIDDEKRSTVGREGRVPIRVAADGRRHLLRVARGEFEFFRSEFSISDGEERVIPLRRPSVPISQSEPPSATPDEPEPVPPKQALRTPEPQGDIPELSEYEQRRSDAEWILANGGHAGTSRKQIREVSDIPDEPFEIIAVHLQNLKTFDRNQVMRLTRIPGVRYLYLLNMSLTDDDLKLIAGMPDLELLAIPGSPITEAGVRHLAGRGKLNSITADRTGIDDASLKLLANFSLVYLRLDYCPITDDGVRHLGNQGSIKALHLHGTQVTDGIVPTLVKLQSLKILGLINTRVSAEGVAQLHRELPDCSIEWRERDPRARVPSGRPVIATPQ